MNESRFFYTERSSIKIRKTHTASNEFLGEKTTFDLQRWTRKCPQ